ncbi:hypothetical protein MMC18_004252 [Xylographa bjoerkii]|nr:hypothetical protein [Xylographa bjoerkii]
MVPVVKPEGVLSKPVAVSNPVVARDPYVHLNWKSLHLADPSKFPVSNKLPVSNKFPVSNKIPVNPSPGPQAKPANPVKDNKTSINKRSPSHGGIVVPGDRPMSFRDTFAAQKNKRFFKWPQKLTPNNVVKTTTVKGPDGISQTNIVKGPNSVSQTNIVGGPNTGVVGTDMVNGQPSTPPTPNTARSIQQAMRRRALQKALLQRELLRESLE